MNSSTNYIDLTLSDDDDPAQLNGSHPTVEADHPKTVKTETDVSPALASGTARNPIVVAGQSAALSPSPSWPGDHWRELVLGNGASGRSKRGSSLNHRELETDVATSDNGSNTRQARTTAASVDGGGSEMQKNAGSSSLNGPRLVDGLPKSDANGKGKDLPSAKAKASKPKQPPFTPEKFETIDRLIEYYFHGGVSRTLQTSANGAKGAGRNDPSKTKSGTPPKTTSSTVQRKGSNGARATSPLHNPFDDTNPATIIPTRAKVKDPTTASKDTSRQSHRSEPPQEHPVSKLLSKRASSAVDASYPRRSIEHSDDVRDRNERTRKRPLRDGSYSSDRERSSGMDYTSSHGLAHVKDDNGLDVDAFSLQDTAQSMESTWERHLWELRKAHHDKVKSLLASSRRRESQTSTRPATVAHEGDHVTKTPAEMAMKNPRPFADSARFETRGSKVDKTATRVSFKWASHTKQPVSYHEHRVSIYDSSGISLPPYTSVLTLRHNYNIENDKKLAAWPYLELSDKERKELDKELSSRYTHGNPDQRPNTVNRIQHVSHQRASVMRFLSEVGCEPSHIISYLLRPLSGNNTVELPIVQARDDSFKGGQIPDRDEAKWGAILAQQPAASVHDLSRAALVCDVFDKMSPFGLWHYVKNWSQKGIAISSTLNDRHNPTSRYMSIACRVCQVHSCPYHGEVTERADGMPVNEDDEEDSLDGDADRDDVEPEDINHKQLVTAPAKVASLAVAKKDFAQNPMEALSAILKNGQPNELAAKLHGARKGWQYWTHNSETADIHGRQPFYPCNHEGSCESARCRCYQEQINCEKTCCCSINCDRRFRGCNCSQTQKTCFKNAKCDCWQLGRECDPDLCGSCGAAEVLDPANRHDEDVITGKCWNVGLQRNVPKRTKIGRSGVAGYGLFTLEPIKRDEYIGEYKGEMIVQEEANRRGTIHHYQPRAYLSQLNKNQELDGTHAGCKMRFLNNSSKDPGQNCYRALLLTGTVTRMAMFARRDIRAGEELFFDYGYAEKEKKRRRFEEPQLDELPTTIFKTKKRKMQGKNGKLSNRATVDGILGQPGIAMSDLQDDAYEESAEAEAYGTSLEEDDVDMSDSVLDYLEVEDAHEGSQFDVAAALADDDSDDSDYDSEDLEPLNQPKKRGRKRRLSL